MKLYYNILVCSVLSTAINAEFNVCLLAGMNLINGKAGSILKNGSQKELYKTNYNLKFATGGICVGYDWFYKWLMVGADASWFYNQSGWREISYSLNDVIRGNYERVWVRGMPQAGIGIRIGYFDERFIPYVRIGIEKIQYKFRIHSVNNGAVPSTSKIYEKTISQSVISAGAGLEYKAYANLWLRAECRYFPSKPYKMQYKSYSAGETPATFTISQQRILLMGGFIYRF